MNPKKPTHRTTTHRTKAPKTASLVVGHTAADGTSIVVRVPPGSWTRRFTWALFGLSGWAAWLTSWAAS